VCRWCLGGRGFRVNKKKKKTPKGFTNQIKKKNGSRGTSAILVLKKLAGAVLLRKLGRRGGPNVGFYRGVLTLLPALVLSDYGGASAVARENVLSSTFLKTRPITVSEKYTGDIKAGTTWGSIGETIYRVSSGGD